MRLLIGDCVESMRSMEAGSVHCCVTSPPYFGLRDYGHEGQIGLEATPDEYVARLVERVRHYGLGGSGGRPKGCVVRVERRLHRTGPQAS